MSESEAQQGDAVNHGYQIEFVPLDKLVPYARNARTHSDQQISEIASSMIEFGFTNPVLADDVSIVAGHGRVMAARQLYDAGYTIKQPNGGALPDGTVPVIDCTGWTDAQRRAYIIMDNRSAEKGTDWDLDLLKIETDALLDEGFDLSLTGFTTDELAEMFATEDVEPEDENDPDEVPETPEEPHSKPGDVWVLGPHRVVVGDATDVTVWDALMGDERADACWTDPPYNVKYEKSKNGAIENDDMNSEDFLEFLQSLFGATYTVLKPGASMYVAHADYNGVSSLFIRALHNAGFHIQSCLIWRKNSLVMGRFDYQSQHEPIIYAWRPGSAHKWFGGRKQTTIIEHGDAGPIRQREDGKWVIEVGDQVLLVDGDAQLEGYESSVIFHDRPRRSAEHPTMKPVGLIEKQLKNSARPGDLVVDGCGGSGSTLIAADRLGMSARLVEYEPKYADVICQRWQSYTGRRATHAESGEQFPSVEAA